MAEFEITEVRKHVWEIPKQGKMNVPGRIYASGKILEDIQQDPSLQQVINVAQLPGIVKYSLAMPDIHWGYGFPIGGVAAFDLDEGIISPGGVGYDINCGVRMLRSDFTRAELAGKMEELIREIFAKVPSGVGSRGFLKLNAREEKEVLRKGARWAVERGFGSEEDLNYIEEGGQMAHANPDVISKEAFERGRPQLGTLGSGNHFIEVDYVEEVYDSELAAKIGLEKDQIVVVVHTGSRGFGYQVCDDFIRKMLKAAEKYGIELPDRQLCCAPFRSPEAQEYYEAMNCAINYAFANRQIISHWLNEAFIAALDLPNTRKPLSIVYELAHNIAKVETHLIDGQPRKVIVHRKGATRSFGPLSEGVPEKYRNIGQPVIIPGDMGRYSYLLVGNEQAMSETFGSSCHGAGRKLSRKQAMKSAKGRAVKRELADKGITAMAASRATMVEEIPEAYKDVAEVVDTVHEAGIARKVVRLRPMGVVKG